MNRVLRTITILLAVWCVFGLAGALFGQATYAAQLRGVVMDPERGGNSRRVGDGQRT